MMGHKSSSGIYLSGSGMLFCWIGHLFICVYYMELRFILDDEEIRGR